MEKKCIVLLSMGGAEDREELKLFLRNMFLDENILPIRPKFFRHIISRTITHFRIDEAYGNYKLIGGSPLKKITEKIAKNLENKLRIKTFIAYRYVYPLSRDVVVKIKEEKFSEVILLPLYPHYSFTTVKSSIEDFRKSLLKGKVKDLRLIELKPFYREKLFNETIIKKILETLKGKNLEEYILVFSAHSIPEKLVKRGDSYKSEIEEHIKILTELFKESGIKFKDITLGYQSKIGPVKWLSPSLDEVLKRLKGEKVIVYPISFVVDNVETLYELSIYYKNKAYEYGLKEYLVLKCQNDGEDFIDFLGEYLKWSFR